MSVSGVLVVDKPAGISSHDVVARVRRKLALRKVGHAGTLDPDATGVLVLCIGDATRALEYLGADDKVYEGDVTFGMSTDTDDASGRIVKQASAWALTEAAVICAATTLVGRIQQQVPAYSAVHIEGKRAYELARAGQTVALPERTVHISYVDVLSFTPGELAKASFRVECSKGTYIRSLCRDWGKRVNLPAHMSALRRMRSGQFGIESAVALDGWLQSEDPVSTLLPTVAAVAGLHKVYLSDKHIQQLAFGQLVACEPIQANGAVAVLSADGDLAAIAEVLCESGSWRLKPKKVFWKGKDCEPWK